jgi:hypothetical protein
MSDSSNVRSSSRERNVFEGKWRSSIGPTFKTNGNPPIGYAKFYSRSHDAVIRVYDACNVIETYEHAGDFKE